MFAVIKTGGKQYRVSPDDTLTIERIEGEEGSRVEFAQVLMMGEGSDVTVGTPAVDGARVTAEVVEQGRSPKTISFKKRRRQNSRRKKGHRQLLTTVSVLEILSSGKKPTKDGSGRSAEDRRREREAAYLAQREGIDAAAASAANDAASADDAASEHAEEQEAMSAAAPAPSPKGSKASTPEPEEAERDADETGADDGDSSTAEIVKDAAEGAVVGAAVGAAAGAVAAAGAAIAGDDTPAKPEGPLFEAPSAEPDKLTKIKGIGPVAERQLNEQGITTFKQIAELTDDEVEKVDTYMPFSAAQIRTWQEQARTLIS